MIIAAIPPERSADRVILDPRDEDYYLGFLSCRRDHFYRLKDGKWTIKKFYYDELNALRYSGLQPDEPIYKILHTLLCTRKILAEELNILEKKYGKELLLRAYLVAQAAGVKTAVTNLHTYTQEHLYELELL